MKKDNFLLPKDFTVVRKTNDTIESIRLKSKKRLILKKKKLVATPESTWEKVYKKLYRDHVKENPIPANISRREYNKLHKLPYPWKVKGMTAYTAMTLAWWDKLSREKQKDFRRCYRGTSFTLLFTLPKVKR